MLRIALGKPVIHPFIDLGAKKIDKDLTAKKQQHHQHQIRDTADHSGIEGRHPFGHTMARELGQRTKHAEHRRQGKRQQGNLQGHPSAL